jgi:cytidylate kinase
VSTRRKIAIDGPVASGKTSVGRGVSRRLDYRFLDTGLMYRAVAWLALERGVDPGDEESTSRLAEGVSMSVSDSEDMGVIVDGVQLGARLREAPVDRVVSLVARISRVRSALVRLQRDIAREGAIVVVGRDIGTVVLPDADVKLYLEASAEERARRRHLEVHGSEAGPGYETVLRDLERRDALDSGRVDSPLMPASDAIVLQTYGLTVDGVVDEVVRIVEAGQWA